MRTIRVILEVELTDAAIADFEGNVDRAAAHLAEGIADASEATLIDTQTYFQAYDS